MSKNIKNIFIPEYVPLENKGEEAIVRGVADVLYPNDVCHVHLLDNVDEYYFDNGIHVYPLKWFISKWLNTEFGLGLSFEKIKDSFFSLIRNGLHKIFPWWVNWHCISLNKTEKILISLNKGNSPRNEKELRIKQLLDCDYIIAGHDGGLDDRVCHILDVFDGLGKKFGVFGVEMPKKFKSNSIKKLMNNTLINAEFFYCRTEATTNSVRKNFENINPITLYDPAFGMKPLSELEVSNLITKLKLDEIFTKDVILCTSCETSPIARFAFDNIKNPDAKLNEHRRIYAQLLDHILDTTNAYILFLPHAIGPGKALDDRIIAKDIISRLDTNNKSRVSLIDELLSAKELKGLIAKSNFLIAERLHSIIGAVGVNTPFMCLASKSDRRVEGILHDMLGMKESTYYLNEPNIKDMVKKFDLLWRDKSTQQESLKKIGNDISHNLSKASSVIRKSIEFK